MIRSLVRPLIRSLVSSLVNGGGDSLRWVWSLNGTSYGQMPTADIAGDYTAKIVIQLPDLLASNSVLFGSATDSGTFFRISPSSSKIEVDIAGNYFSHTGATFTTDIMTFMFTRTGSTTKCFVDDVEIFSTDTPTSAAFDLGLIGMRSTSTNFLTSAVRSFEISSGITNLGVYATGTANFKLLEAYSVDHEFVDSDNSVIGDKFNDVPADYEEVPA